MNTLCRLALCCYRIPCGVLTDECHMPYCRSGCTVTEMHANCLHLVRKRCSALLLPTLLSIQHVFTWTLRCVLDWPHHHVLCVYISVTLTIHTLSADSAKCTRSAAARRAGTASGTPRSATRTSSWTCWRRPTPPSTGSSASTGSRTCPTGGRRRQEGGDRRRGNNSQSGVSA